MQAASGVSGAQACPVLAGLGVRPTSLPAKDRDLLRRDVVVLVAAGPTSTAGVTRAPGSVSEAAVAAETSYVYYTAIPRFCAVATTPGNTPVSVVLPPSGAGALTAGGTVWASFREAGSATDSTKERGAIENGGHSRKGGENGDTVPATTSNQNSMSPATVDVNGSSDSSMVEGHLFIHMCVETECVTKVKLERNVIKNTVRYDIENNAIIAIRERKPRSSK